jgi:hypothetical protein
MLAAWVVQSTDGFSVRCAMHIVAVGGLDVPIPLVARGVSG